MAQFRRNENPPFFEDYREYLPWLRQDFRQRCAYCERTEVFLRGDEHFEIDHFKPRSRFPELMASYQNLYYSCRKCNSHKSTTWPSTEDIGRGFRFSDPCVEDMYSVHLRERTGGSLEALTNCGRYTQQHIRLDRPALLNWRQARRAVLEDIANLESALKRLEDLASAEADDVKKHQILLEVAGLQYRIQTDRNQFT